MMWQSFGNLSLQYVNSLDFKVGVWHLVVHVVCRGCLGGAWHGNYILVDSMCMGGAKTGLC